MRRSVLVTGGYRGLGLEIARTFAAAGDAVAVTHRGADRPDDLAADVLGLPCDVTDTAQVDRAFAAAKDAHGPVEVLVANAGVTDDRLLVRMTDEQFARVLDVNLGGAFRAARAAVGGMSRLRRGRIVLVSSATAVRGVAGQTNYAASKAGLIGFARSLAREVGRRGITVNAVTPGLLDTDMIAALPAEHRTRMLDDTPLGRMATLQEVAAATFWLASEPAGAITGAILPVDGGAGLGH